MRGPLPSLHIVTDDEVLADPLFMERAVAVVKRGGSGAALHLRGHHTATRRLYQLAAALRPVVHAAGGLLFVNDRVDVALAAGADGVQLGTRSIPLRAARQLLGQRWIGYSAHTLDELVAAEASGTDFVLLGTIYASASHPSSPGSGLDLVWRAGKAVHVPVLAIGGITPARVNELTLAGAYGAAVLGAVWRNTDPAASVSAFIDALAGHAQRRSQHAGNGNHSD